MHETKSKWFKKVLRATLCFLVVCGSLSAMLFVPNKGEETPQVPIEKELCVYSAPPQVSPTPTPISIEEEPAEHGYRKRAAGVYGLQRGRKPEL